MKVLATVCAMIWPIFATASINYESLKETIETKKLSSVPEILAALPEDFRSNYNLIRDSLSLQGTSPAQPRVIFHTTDFKFILAVNGDPQTRGYNTVEMIQFRDQTKEFDFREIKIVEGKVEFSEATPRKCQACHGISPRPFLGESGDSWNEAFASSNDYILDPNAKKEFSEFLKLRPGHERYKFLIRKNTSRDYPFSEYRSDFNKFGDLALRPTFRMSAFLSRLNAQRIAKYFFQAPLYKAKPYTAMYWLNCNISDLYTFEGVVLLPAFEAQYPQDKFGYLYKELQEVGNGGSSGIGRDLFFMEKLLTGIEVRTWNLHRLHNHHGNDWIWFSGMLNQDEWIRQLVFEEFARNYPEFSSYVQKASISGLMGEEFYRKVFRNKEISTAYENLGPIYDRGAAEQSCGKLKTLSDQELQQ